MYKFGLSTAFRSITFIFIFVLELQRGLNAKSIQESKVRPIVLG